MAAPLAGPRGPLHVRYGLRFLRDPFATLLELSERYGPVFRFGMGPFRMVYLIGPHANECVLRTASHALRVGEAYDLLRLIGGDGALLVSDGDDHRRRRAAVVSKVAEVNGERAVSIAWEEANRVIDGWQEGQVRDLFPEFRGAILRTVTRTLFGERLGSRSEELRAYLEELLVFVNLWPWQQARLDLPGTRWRRARKARAALDLVIGEEIHEVEGRVDSSGLIAGLLEAGLSRGEVRDLVASLITAGFDTTSASLAWTLYALGNDVDAGARARRECLAQTGAPARWTRPGHLDYVERAILESLRLYSPAFLGVRRVAEPFTFDGHEIRPGATIAYSPYVTHRLESAWNDARSFRPERWDRGDPAYTKHAAFSFVPFGGGEHRCVGEQLALAELRTMVCAVLRRTRLRLVGPAPIPAGLSAMHPKHGLSVRVESVRRGSN